MRAPGPANTARLVGAIYEAALDSTRWPAFMDELRSSLRAGFGMLWIHDFSDGTDCFDRNGSNLWAIAGLDEAEMTCYAQHYGGCNVWIPNASRLAEGSLAVSSSLYPDEKLVRTEFYAGWLRRLDLFHGLGSAAARTGARRQVDLVRTVLTGPAMLQRPMANDMGQP